MSKVNLGSPGITTDSAYTWTGVQTIADDTRFLIGTSGDNAFYHRTATLTANTALANVLIGTPVTPALAANSLIISNVTTDGDIMIAANDGGTSYAGFFMDGSAGTTDIRAKGAINFMASSDVDDYLTITTASNVVTLTATGSSFNFVGAAEFDGITRGGAVAGGDQAFTGVGDMTFTAGSILKSGSTNGNTLLIASNDTTFITMTTGATDVCTINAPTMSGTWLASGTVTLPAVTLGGTVSLGGQTFNAGATSLEVLTSGGQVGLKITSTTSAGSDGAGLTFLHTKAGSTIDDGDQCGAIFFRGLNDAATPEDTIFGIMYGFCIDNADGAEIGQLSWYVMNTGTNNLAMTLSGAGVLAVDLAGSGTPAQVDLFDAYDDAIVIRQGIQQNNRELLADIGVLNRKDTGSGYMMNIQPMVRLLAGGIYQTRARIDELVEVIRDEFPQVAERLAERKLIGV